MLPKVDRLTFAWWNTALSPPVTPRKKRKDDDYREAAAIITSLLQEFHVDCLTLGEVTSWDLCKLLNDVKAGNYAIYDGKAIHDVGAIYNTQRLTEFDTERITDYDAGEKLKVAHRVDFLIQGEERPLHVFISHWPSRIRSEDEPKRIRLACRLRQKVTELMARYEQEAPVILMGDFNDEPFHESMEQQLKATRDRCVAKRSTHLYNPFWRHMGESAPYNPISDDGAFAGTCSLKSDRVTRWKTVDQIIVSSAFLGGSTWHLNEQLTMILDLRKAARRGYSSRGVFDHLPVIAVIEKARHEGGQTHD
jgi:hypothetical protein